MNRISSKKVGAVGGFVALLAATTGFQACSADGVNDEVVDSDEVVASAQLGLATDPSACYQQEAENMQRLGSTQPAGLYEGSPSTLTGYTLTAPDHALGEYVWFAEGVGDPPVGRHRVRVYARAVAGGGQWPVLNVKVNGASIGAPREVINVGGWSVYEFTFDQHNTSDWEYLSFSINNPGSGRAIHVDGFTVICPVYCDGTSCGECCYDQQAGGTRCSEDSGACNGLVDVAVSCDSDEDCAPGSVCCDSGHVNLGHRILCKPVGECGFEALPSYAYEICDSPGNPEVSCEHGGTCTAYSSGLPGWKFCDI